LRSDWPSSSHSFFVFVIAVHLAVVKCSGDRKVRASQGHVPREIDAARKMARRSQFKIPRIPEMTDGALSVLQTTRRLGS